MALTECAECGKEISSKAAACPHCGAKPRTSSVPYLVTAALTVLMVGYCQLHTSPEDEAKQIAASRATKAEQERRAAMTADARAIEDKVVAEQKARAKAADAEREANFQRALALLRMVKTHMHDPSSLDVEDAFYTDEGAIAIKYRGKNAFGATIINYAVATKDGKASSGSQRDVAPLWNKYIAKKGGTDLTSSVRGAKLLGAY